MNKYVGVEFKGRKKSKNKEVFIVSQDLIKRGVMGSLFIEIEDKFLQITNEVSILEWIKQSKDNKLYIFKFGKFQEIGLNDIPFEDYLKIYSPKENKVGQFIINKYLMHNEKQCEFVLSIKIDDFQGATYCEYYNNTQEEFVYTERILGLDRIIEDKKLKSKIKAYFEEYKKESL